ncbi:hypothetical protein QY880_05660 [Latilactobacillus sakei]
MQMNPQNGLTQITLKGSGQMTVFYQETPLQKVGHVISVVSLISLMMIIYKAQSNKKLY